MVGELVWHYIYCRIDDYDNVDSSTNSSNSGDHDADNSWLSCSAKPITWKIIERKEFYECKHTHMPCEWMQHGIDNAGFAVPYYVQFDFHRNEWKRRKRAKLSSSSSTANNALANRRLPLLIDSMSNFICISWSNGYQNGEHASMSIVCIPNFTIYCFKWAMSSRLLSFSFVRSLSHSLQIHFAMIEMRFVAVNRL